MPGTPDWQKATQVQDAPIANISTEYISSGQNYNTGLIAINSWRTIRLHIGFNAGYGTVQILFNDVDNAILPQYTKTWNLNVNTDLDILVPVMGQYFEVIVSNEDSITATASIYIAACNVPVSDITYPNIGSGDYQTTAKIAASTTETVYPQLMYAGSATVSFTPYDTSGKIAVTVQKIKYDGTVLETAADLGQPTTATIQRISVPGDLVVLNLTNTDSAGPHSSRAALVRD